MLTILTPSKTMDFTTPAPAFALGTAPLFQTEASRLRQLLATYTVDQIKDLMRVSDVLTEKTLDMYTREVAKQAFWAYDGDVFKGVQAKSLDESAAVFAQAHIIVPSAIYGLVRPYDMISPYRLEMKAKLAVGSAKNLYEFWGDKLAHYVDQAANGEVLMLSSYEYARTMLPHLAATTRVVTPAFIDKKPNGEESQVAIYNKMMRGVMARWVIDNKSDSLADIHLFTAHGYAYDADRSSEDKPVFYRTKMTPLVF
jgi:cytoplasmic iron level regulating protein YaaA (DUF328/UPF0246 family)